MYTVLFDVGNVLINFDHRVISRRLVSHAPKNRQSNTLQDKLHGFIFGTAELPSRTIRLDRGENAISTLRDALIKEFDLTVSDSDFETIWSSIFADRLNGDTIHCLNRLLEGGLNVAFCSNTNSAHWKALLAMQPELSALSDRITCFLSHELGKLKADPGFFDIIAERTGCANDCHLLIDDLADNCAAAESVGMHAIVFNPANPGESIRSIDSFVNTNGWLRGTD